MTSSAEIYDAAAERVAIVGMAGRFPQAESVAELWEVLAEGRETISFFARRELETAGVDRALLDHPKYVAARGVVQRAALFSPDFWGYTPREAMCIDPQQRLLLECAWEALEDAGQDSAEFPGRIGVFAGARRNSYLPSILMPSGAVRLPDDASLLRITNDRDFLSSRLSYLLGLTGPSVVVQTACSTSLTAVHLACRSLLDFDCDMALAGGVALTFPQQRGYLHEEGGIGSPDGHCRVFDERARGCCGADGVGIVALRRLADAIEDGNRIHAVILGSAANNDGARRVGFTAPGVDGQLAAITEALTQSEVDARSISYVEAHGTGTHLGDPIEIEALTRAFRQWTDDRGFCTIGSLKTNLGHMDAAAGVGGLIKTVLALKHELIPATLHFNRPNPALRLESSPFRVHAEGQPWPRRSTPRRAGVSAFGMGGSNVHVVLEEAPPKRPADEAHPLLVFPLSAKTATALGAQQRQLGHHLRSHSDLAAADVAFTLQVGRKAFDHRHVIFARNLPQVTDQLLAPNGPPRGGETRGSEATDREAATRSIGRRWLQGGSVDWRELQRPHHRQRVSLPGYPFERRRCWPEADGATADRLSPASWFSLRSWQEEPLRSSGHGEGLAPGPVLILADAVGLGDQLGRRLERLGRSVTTVLPGAGWDDSDARTTRIRADQPQDYLRLLRRLRASGQWPCTILHLWSVSPDPISAASREAPDTLGLLSLVYLTQALHDASAVHPARIVVIGSGVFPVREDDLLSIDKSTVRGACTVIPQEYPTLETRLIDIPCPPRGEELADAADLLWQEILHGDVGEVCAYRDGRRRVERLLPIATGSEEDGAQCLRKHGVYLITGGFGGIGLTLARGLARSVDARLALVGQTPLPTLEDLHGDPEDGAPDDPIATRLRALRELRGLGSEVTAYSADVSDRRQLAGVVDDIVGRWGTIDGIIHAAGVPGGTVMQLLSIEILEAIAAPKIRGAILLDELTREMQLDFFVLCSSLSAVFGGAGNAHYAAANAFLDTFAIDRTKRTGHKTLSIGWDTWQQVGMAATAEPSGDGRRRQEALRYGLRPEEGWTTFLRALGTPASHLLVSTRPLEARRAAFERIGPSLPASSAPAETLEASILEVWRTVLGDRELALDDNFFDVGGNSLLGLQLVREMEAKLGSRLPLSALSRLSTVEKMAAAVRADRDGSQTRPPAPLHTATRPRLSDEMRRGLLAVLAGTDLPAAAPHLATRVLHSTGSAAPLFWCFNVPGSEPRRIAGRLGPEQPIYALFSGVGVLDWHQNDTVDRVADGYLEEILALQPEGPIRLGGNCAGGRVACALAFRLQEVGRELERLCLLESFDPRLYGFTSPLLLLYGRQSELRVQDRFGWPEPGWERPFRRPPEVHWIPGAHGEFFDAPNIGTLGNRITGFLADGAGITDQGPSAARKRSWRRSGSSQPEPRPAPEEAP